MTPGRAARHDRSRRDGSGKGESFRVVSVLWVVRKYFLVVRVDASCESLFEQGETRAVEIAYLSSEILFEQREFRRGARCTIEQRSIAPESAKLPFSSELRFSSETASSDSEAFSHQRSVSSGQPERNEAPEGDALSGASVTVSTASQSSPVMRPGIISSDSAPCSDPAPVRSFSSSGPISASRTIFAHSFP